MKKNLVALSVAIALSGCGGNNGDSPPPQSNPTTPTPPVATPSATLLPQQDAQYADVFSVDLTDLGLPSTLTASDLSVTSGNVRGVTVKDGQLRFITLSDDGVDQDVIIRVTANGQQFDLPVLVRSTRPIAIDEAVHAAEDPTVPLPAPTPLLVKGMGQGNTLTATDLSFTISGAPAFSVDSSSATVEDRDGHIVNLAALWSFDPATNTFTIPAAKMATLLTGLPNTSLTVSVGLVSEDGDYAKAYDFLAVKGGATLTGSVVDINGQPVTGLAGRLIGLRGAADGVRRVVAIGADGSFSAANLLADTYEATILDAEFPGFNSATIPIYPTTTAASVTITYTGDNATKTTQAAKSVSGGKAMATRTTSTTTQNGSGPASRNAAPQQNMLQPFAATPSTCETVSDNASVFQAIAAQKDQTISCNGTVTVPQGTSNVSLSISVATDEYPTYTTSQSQYNDTWSYSVSGLPGGATSASGSVNTSHYTQGTITKTQCVDVSTYTKSGPLTFQLALAATNVGDSALPTTVTATYKPSCDGSLSVTRADFGTKLPDGSPVIKPIKTTGNLPGSYVSLPIATVKTDWGVPLTVKYQPTEAKITKARIGVLVGGQPVWAADDILPKASKNGAGVVSFANLVMPAFALQRFTGKTTFVVELTGTVDGKEVTSKGKEGVVYVGSDSTVTPMFFGGEFVGAARRYGQGSPDAGGDSWIVDKALTWILPKSYLFNDVSALHVKQTATGRSVMGHSGHSDGHQLDLRYADGLGGFTGALNGDGEAQAVANALNAAKQEVASNAAQKPKLALVTKWINDNRSMIEAEAPSARRIYIGKSFIEKALISGAFADGTPIPGITKWTNKPAIVKPEDAHMHHWHISLQQ